MTLRGPKEKDGRGSHLLLLLAKECMRREEKSSTQRASTISHLNIYHSGKVGGKKRWTVLLRTVQIPSPVFCGEGKEKKKKRKSQS